MRLATYNIHDCVGRDGRFAPERIATILADFDADLIALQEVTLDHPGTLVKLFSQTTGMQAVDGSLIPRGIGRYGNLVLTRERVLKSRLHDLACPGCEPRGCIELELETAAGRLLVFATHLGLRWRERRQQIRSLQKLLDKRQDPMVLLGDLNLWGRGLALRTLESIGFGQTSVRSFPTWPTPLFALDRILVHPPARIESCRRYDTSLARMASDHFPILAELQLVG